MSLTDDLIAAENDATDAEIALCKFMETWAHNRPDDLKEMLDAMADFLTDVQIEYHSIH